jgi:ferrichrome ATP binding cassette transporter, ABC protein
MTVEEFVRFGRFPYTKGKITKEDERIVEEALVNTNLASFRTQDIGTLSGGQYQRALIAMVLAQDTEWILLDEPLNHLDLKQAYEVMNLLRFLVDEKEKSIVIVMHDLNMASNFSDEIACFKDGKCIIHDTVDKVMKDDVLSALYEIPLEVVELNDKKICIIKNGELK